MKLQPATQIAAHIIHALFPHCAIVRTAGSIRREKAQVKDIEIVYISQTSSQQIDLFGAAHLTYYHANTAITTLIHDGLLRKDTTVKRWGPKYKRAIHIPSGMVIEFFRAERANWAYIFALRTGPAAFNKLLVTKRRHGGALPPQIALRAGHVWYNATQLPVSTELAFFAALDLPLIPPQDRTALRLMHCLTDRRNQ